MSVSLISSRVWRGWLKIASLGLVVVIAGCASGRAVSRPSALSLAAQACNAYERWVTSGGQDTTAGASAEISAARAAQSEERWTLLSQSLDQVVAASAEERQRAAFHDYTPVASPDATVNEQCLIATAG